MMKNLFLTAVCAVLVCAGLSGCQSHPGRQDTEKGLQGQNVSSAVITGAALGGGQWHRPGSVRQDGQ